MPNDVLRHLHIGFLRLHVLYHADQEQICGVEIAAELRGHGYRVGPGTLYPLLHDLQARGYLRARDAVVRGKRRRYFRITSKGRSLLRRAQVKLRELSAEILDDRDGRKGTHA
jgi:DNA-binding PadR family transcriptional regulator